jgi:serine/threonine protein kinase
LAENPRHQAFRWRFESEAAIMHQLMVTGVVPRVFQYSEPGFIRPWFVMEYLNNYRQLDHFKGGGYRLHATVALRCAQAVGAVHAQDCLHRDLSPDNILVSDDRRRDVKLIDFGLARWRGRDDNVRLLHLTTTGEMAGKPAYTAPEVWVSDQGLLTAGMDSDGYGLAACLWELFTGKPPFQGELHEIEAQQRMMPSVEPLLLARVPPPVAQTMAAMLAPERELRPSVRDLQHEIMRTLQGW